MHKLFATPCGASEFQPALAAPQMATVSHLPRSDWRIGAPMFFCAMLQALALALVHFRRQARKAAVAPLPTPLRPALSTRIGVSNGPWKIRESWTEMATGDSTVVFS